MKIRPKKKPSVSQLKKKADKIFSEYIRRRDALHGQVRCFTCLRRYPWKEIQAGHFITRSANELRYDERNVNPQCVSCNVFKNGNHPAYFVEMERRYGREVVDELLSKKNEIHQFKVYELEDLINWYRDKLDSLDNF